MIAPETRYRQKEGLLSQRAAETRVLLDPSDGNYFALDDVSGRIWDLCDGNRTVAEIVAALCAEYDAPRETVEADVLEFLGELLTDGLVISQP
jgi:pyrroloquinoline quinone biosynthesis protein D